MAKFDVTIHFEIFSCTTITVEADDPEDASTLAIDEFMDTPGWREANVVEVEVDTLDEEDNTHD